MTQIERGFVSIREGQVHLRRSAGLPAGPARPLWMVHASPASSISLVPLMQALAPGRPVIAPDTLGNGDSVAAAPSVPDIACYADSSLRAMDALGIGQADLYGSHTGAHIVVEMAISQPQRFGRIVLDGIGMFSPEQKQRMLASYAPAITPDFFGSQIHWAWHFVRDQAWYFPYFARDVAHLRNVAPPGPEALHRTTVEVLKAIGTYHHAYRAAFAHPDRERLPLVRHETLAMADDEDPLKVGVSEAVALLPRGSSTIFHTPPGGEHFAAKAALMSRFLDTGAVG